MILNRGMKSIRPFLFIGSFSQERGRKLISIEANSGNEYDKLEQVKGDIAARGIAAFLNDGSNEKAVTAKDIYGAQVARMNATDKLKRMTSDERQG